VPPNLLYLHSHDTGRHVQPYGFDVATPNIQRFADEGTLYTQAFSAAPVCSPSRAALLTGTFGMRGLAHRGWRLPHRERHIVHPLRAAGYSTVMVGEQHVMPDPGEIGYDAILDGPVAETAAAFLRREHAAPFFLSVGFEETHRPYPPATGEQAVPAHLPDVPEIRRDMAGFHASAEALDEHVGTVLDAVPDDTVVVLTTDHGLPFPGAKATLTDRGLGVLLIIRGPGFAAGAVSDALVSQLDLYPTLLALAGAEPPDPTPGRSLLSPERDDAVFAELTYHAAYEPQRAVRTERHKYIRRFDNGHEGPVLANIDDSPSKDYLLAHGLAERTPPAEALYDLAADPGEADNLAADPAHAAVLDALRRRLHTWMESTDDPLLRGPVAPDPGVEINLPAQRSPDDPTTRA